MISDTALKTIFNVLKAAGVKLDDATVRELETILPQVPGKVKEVLTVLDSALQLMDARMQQSLANDEKIIGLLEDMRLANNPDAVEKIPPTQAALLAGTLTLPEPEKEKMPDPVSCPHRNVLRGSRCPQCLTFVR